MFFAAVSKATGIQFILLIKITLLIGGFDTPQLARSYSTTRLVYLFYFPIEARADGSLPHFGPLCAGRAGDIHVE